MKNYMYTVLLCISCLIALPFITKKVFPSFFVKQEAQIENDTLTENGETAKNGETAGNGELVENGESVGNGELIENGESVGNEEQAENGEPIGNEELAENGESIENGEAAAENGELTENSEPIKENGEPDENEKPETEATFTKVDRDYFKDALFIGDSRTVGLSEYADLNGADVFADSGMNVYKLKEQKIKVKGVGKTTLEQLLKKRTYGKIYVMLGINELGYDYKQTVKRFKELIEEIREKQPEAIIFIGANLHVTGGKSKKSDIYNNKNINRFNKAIAKLADKKDIFYIDVNEIFDDKNGNLDKKYTVDESHVLGKYYSEWADWILEKGIVR